MRFTRKQERVLRLLAAIVVWLGIAGGLLAVITGVLWVLQAPSMAILMTVLSIVGGIWIVVLLLGAYIDCYGRRKRK